MEVASSETFVPPTAARAGSPRRGAVFLCEYYPHEKNPYNFRIERAARALRMTSATIAEVAVDCGYPAPFYFSRVFKRHTGQSPAAFRTNTLRQNCRIHSILQESQS